MPRLSGVTIRERRALNRLQVSKAVPPQEMRLEPGRWVRVLRVALHMTQRQLTARAKVSQGHVALIEKGRLEPQLATLRRIFDALYCGVIVLPVPARRVSDILAEKTCGVPTRRLRDS
jgi:transcriptional regulator with XRE-family HTH domain